MRGMSCYIDNALISIIVPVYNVEPYLQEALDSLKKQTYQDLEILLIDDGSTDGSGEICDEYTLCDKRFSVFHQENHGLSAARNIGLNLIHGQYVTFLDPDDAFYPEMIERMLEAIITTGADLVICGFDVYRTEKRMGFQRAFMSHHFKYAEQFSSSEALNRLISGSLTTAVWNKLYKKNLWENVRFLEDHVYEETGAMHLILEQCQSVTTLPQTLVMHRKRRGSITASFDEKSILDWFLAYDLLQNYVNAHTSDVFRLESVFDFHERYLRSMIVLYAEKKRAMYSISDTIFLKGFREKILKRMAAIKSKRIKHTKTRVACFLFMYLPQLILPARAFFRFWKKC